MSMVFLEMLTPTFQEEGTGGHSTIRDVQGAELPTSKSGVSGGKFRFFPCILNVCEEAIIIICYCTE